MIDIHDVARRIKAENEREAKLLRNRRAKARDIARRIAGEMLLAYPECGRVWGFGSVFESWRGYRMDSDIDLAVDFGNEIALLKIARDRDFDIDVVDLSECDSGLTDFIRANGELLAGGPP